MTRDEEVQDLYRRYNENFKAVEPLSEAEYARKILRHREGIEPFPLWEEGTKIYARLEELGALPVPFDG